MRMELKRTGDAPGPEEVLGGTPCEFWNYTGPLQFKGVQSPVPQLQAGVAAQAEASTAAQAAVNDAKAEAYEYPGGRRRSLAETLPKNHPEVVRAVGGSPVKCPFSNKQHKRRRQLAETEEKKLAPVHFEKDTAPSNATEHCVKLGWKGINFKPLGVPFDYTGYGSFGVMNATFEYKASQLPCMPCDVEFRLTMPTPEGDDQYIALGFKERYQAYMEEGQGAMECPEYVSTY